MGKHTREMNVLPQLVCGMCRRRNRDDMLWHNTKGIPSGQATLKTLKALRVRCSWCEIVEFEYCFELRAVTDN